VIFWLLGEERGGGQDGRLSESQDDYVDRCCEQFQLHVTVREKFASCEFNALIVQKSDLGAF